MRVAPSQAAKSEEHAEQAMQCSLFTVALVITTIQYSQPVALMASLGGSRHKGQLHYV